MEFMYMQHQGDFSDSDSDPDVELRLYNVHVEDEEEETVEDKIPESKTLHANNKVGENKNITPVKPKTKSSSKADRKTEKQKLDLKQENNSKEFKDVTNPIHETSASRNSKQKHENKESNITIHSARKSIERIRCDRPRLHMNTDVNTVIRLPRTVTPVAESGNVFGRFSRYKDPAAYRIAGSSLYQLPVRKGCIRCGHGNTQRSSMKTQEDFSDVRSIVPDPPSCVHLKKYMKNEQLGQEQVKEWLFRGSNNYINWTRQKTNVTPGQSYDRSWWKHGTSLEQG